MVIITLKTILNEKIGYRFCQVILLFWLQQNLVPYSGVPMVSRARGQSQV